MRKDTVFVFCYSSMLQLFSVFLKLAEKIIDRCAEESDSHSLFCCIRAGIVRNTGDLIIQIQKKTNNIIIRFK